MEIERAAISDVLIVHARKLGDARGFFSETFKASLFAEFGVEIAWAQDNHSRSTKKGVVRGLHFQAPPAAQAKLVRVVKGAIFDVAVDIRKGSPTYGAHVATELSDANWRQIFIPPGFAHGFCTLTKEAEVLYKTSAEYRPEAEGGLHWRDSALAIDWPVRKKKAVLSDRDRLWPRFDAFQSPFA